MELVVITNKEWQKKIIYRTLNEKIGFLKNSLFKIVVEVENYEDYFEIQISAIFITSNDSILIKEQNTSFSEVLNHLINEITEDNIQKGEKLFQEIEIFGAKYVA